MPEKKTTERARRDKRQGKSASTQAGEYVREEMDHIREGKHGARSAKQAIAIGLSKARRAGVKLPPRPGSNSHSSPRSKRRHSSETSRTRSRATLKVLRRESKAGASHRALSRQTRSAAHRRS